MKIFSTLIVVAFLLTSCAAPASIPGSTPSPVTAITPSATTSPVLPWVHMSGLGFTMDGQPFRFIGANNLNFGFYKEYGLSIDQAIRSARENGIRVIRISLGDGQGTWGGTPWEEYDRALDIAAKNGVYIIANLNEGCCFQGEPTQTREQYLKQRPFVNMTSDSSVADFEAFIQSVLLRRNTVNGRIYRDDPTILAWDIINEPAVELFSSDELHTWLDRLTSYIKTVDPNHLVTIGLNMSPSTYSTPGPQYQALDVPGLDYFSFHYNTVYGPAVNSNLDAIRYRAEMLRSMGKPVMLEEFGAGSQRIFPDNVSSDTLNDWIQVYKSQFDAAFSAGASGALFWGWGVPETKKVLLYWRLEDHDSSETQFTQLLRDYQMPPVPPEPVAALQIATPQPTQVVPPDVYVNAVCTLIGRPRQTHVASGSPVVILWGWRTDTSAHLQDFLDNNIVTVTLDGRNISDHAPFGIASSSPGNFLLRYFAQVGVLSAGTHKIVLDESWKAMISDGTDTYGPGGKFLTQHDECDIIVG